MGCPKLTERDYFTLRDHSEKTAYSRFFRTATDDQIGNRKTYDTAESGSNVQSVYTSNNLNQYTAITNPTNSPTYDDDGNMLTLTLDTGDWTNTFNAENRIISMETASKKLEFTYDYMGRRVEKKVYSGSAGNWTLTKHLRFVYDGYKQIEKLDALNSNSILARSVWQSERLLSVQSVSSVCYAVGDANKNITDYLDSTGAIQAHYEYSPFGKITKSSGTMVDDFDYRFSSEVFDTETGLVYYNYRYYSPELGRWLSRDPIAEQGGLNLYAMVANNPINSWDKLGLEDCKPCCGGKHYDPKTQCCENDQIVEKVAIWIAEVNLNLFGATTTSLITHTQVYENDPLILPPSGNYVHIGNVSHQNLFGVGTLPTSNPGYGLGPHGLWQIPGMLLLPTCGSVSGHDTRPVIEETISKKMVCPAKKKYLLSKHNTLFYWALFPIFNCHGYPTLYGN